jgi:hypothetical protein
MFVRGRRVADVPVLQKPALQSDYVAAWGNDNPAAAQWTQGYSSRWVKLKHLQLHVLPRLLRWLDPLLGWRSRRACSFANRAHFKPVR